MSEIQWSDAEWQELDELAHNLGHVDDDPQTIHSRRVEIEATVCAIVAERERQAAARALHVGEALVRAASLLASSLPTLTPERALQMLRSLADSEAQP